MGGNTAILRSTRDTLAVLWTDGTSAGRDDGDLLARFLSTDRQRAEHAFALLVQRHGPLVMRVCRAVLRDPHAADDAFQATFLVLAQKAGRLSGQRSLAPWLSTVSWRVASRARSRDARRRRLEARTPTPPASTPADDPESTVFLELARLPEPFRQAVTLCDLHDLSHAQAAEILGIPVGTVKSRQARGRARLRQRLERLGLGSILPTTARLELPPDLAATVAARAVGLSNAQGLLPALALLACLGLAAAAWGLSSSGQNRSTALPTHAADVIISQQNTSSIALRVLDPSGNETRTVGLMLWKELAEGEEPNDFVWSDPSSGKRWDYFRNWNPGYPQPDPFGFDELPAGTYRVSATRWHGDGPSDPTPFGVSSPVTLESNASVDVTVHQAGHPAHAGPQIVVSDAAEPDTVVVPYAHVRLRRADDGFPIFDGWGNGAFADQADAGGRCRYENLPPGSYTIEILGRRSFTFGELDYDPTPQPVPLVVTAEERGASVRPIRVASRPLTRAEIAERWPYVVRGTVTDNQDRPLPNVEMRAHAGMGTLKQTGSTRTGPDGSYLLRFSHGAMMMRKSKDDLTFNMAVLMAKAPGYYAPDLERDSSFAAFSRQPTQEELARFRAVPDERMIVANEPYELNVVLIRSARVDLRLLDRQGHDLQGWSIGVESLAGLPLSKTAAPGGDTSYPGAMGFDLPAGRYRFHANPPRDSGLSVLSSEPIDLTAPSLNILELRIPPEGNLLQVQRLPIDP